MKTSIILGGVFLVALAVIGYAVLTAPGATLPAPVQTHNPVTDGSAPAQTPAATNPSSAPAPAPAQPSGYTMAQVAQHSSTSSCWSAINGKVYDLTAWINQHPGGPERILSICGADGSAAFNAQHGGQNQPAQILTSFYIGTLAS